MLRKDTEAKLVRTYTQINLKFGSANGEQGPYYFQSGEMKSLMSLREYDALLGKQGKQMNAAVAVLKSGRKTWWMFRDEFWCEDEGYSASEMEVLILAKRKQRQQKIVKAAAIVNATHDTVPGQREGISDKVKTFVWQRDGGKCVKCGSHADLEFDHIIPIALGGSNTARNIQLLCERCNRSKGKSLVWGTSPDAQL